jgi:hypothetical protein
MLLLLIVRLTMISLSESKKNDVPAKVVKLPLQEINYFAVKNYASS